MKQARREIVGCSPILLVLLFATFSTQPARFMMTAIEGSEVIAAEGHVAQLPSETSIDATQTIRQLVGRWSFDLDFAGEYFHKVSEIQRVWCGFGWSEEDMKRREAAVRSDAAQHGPPTTWDIRDNGDGSFRLRTQGNSGASPTTTVISACKSQAARITCAQSPAVSQPFVVEVAGQYVFFMFRMTPSSMSCQLQSRSPDEVWLRFIRFKRER